MHIPKSYFILKHTILKTRFYTFLWDKEVQYLEKCKIWRLKPCISSGSVNWAGLLENMNEFKFSSIPAQYKAASCTQTNTHTGPSSSPSYRGSRPQETQTSKAYAVWLCVKNLIQSDPGPHNIGARGEIERGNWIDAKQLAKAVNGLALKGTLYYFVPLKCNFPQKKWGVRSAHRKDNLV